ncbi:ABC transporter ATP-binding protein [Azospirillum doebereinerae]|uniref:ABC transporter ATP-binding protein n=1 Tax=Azospirillum doebereinerae TaxID=92933 RepID=A0A3S0XKF1_9PROT|nr:ABC transporter ATP-binding protein [Azospirillum doebereinerae]MCG5238322.1 ABC transporter ATP-binding protein [Azospirillum doebereinerae]RUQ66795.1 ABC transporter ATP-binding protein [Azospirillum doebereinerae]
MRLEIEGLSVRYGAVQALEDVSLVVPSGTTTAIIGANGAGKSTFLKAVAGLVPPQGGRILVEGRDLAALTVEARHALGVVLCPEGRRLFPDLTVHENLLAGALRRKGRAAVAADIAAVYDRFPRLDERRGSLARNLSGGEQQMAAIGRALVGRPRLLLLDEPSLGLAPGMVRVMADAIRAIAAAGVTLLLVEQNARLALTLAATGHVLEAGRRVLSGDAAALIDDPRVRDAYLGGAETASPASPEPARSW